MKRETMKTMLVVTVGLILAGGGELLAADMIGIQGTLTDAAGDPLTGARVWRVQFYDAETSGTALGVSLTGTTTVEASGRFAIALTPPPEVIASPTDVWYALAIDSVETPDGVIGAEDVFADRVQVCNVLFARRAAQADIATTAIHILNHNRPPVAVLEADRRVVVVGSPISAGAVNFSMSLSYDPEGGALDYGFDLTGVQSGYPVYGASPATSQTYTVVGTYLAEGWARDGDSLFDLDKVTIEVQASGGVTAVDTAGVVGEYASLAVVNGAPAVAYIDGYGDLKYVRASDALGGAWAPPVTVDTAGWVGEHASLAMVNGAPAIAYYDFTNEDLKYVRAADVSGASWATPVAVDTTGTVGRFSSLAVVNGAPAIAYFDGANGNLKYVRATDASGASWAAAVVVDATGWVGEYASLAVVNGAPAIAYFDSTDYDLKYARATDAWGEAWAPPVAVDTAGNVGLCSSLAVIDGVPAIAYYDLTNEDLKYVRAADAAGASWATPVAVDSAGNTGQYASLAAVNGAPAIAYLNSTDYNLKYVRATDASGASWATSLAVDTAGVVGQYASLAVVNGAPAIAYFDNTNDDLKYAR